MPDDVWLSLGSRSWSGAASLRGVVLVGGVLALRCLHIFGDDGLTAAPTFPGPRAPSWEQDAVGCLQNVLNSGTRVPFLMHVELGVPLARPVCCGGKLEYLYKKFAVVMKDVAVVLRGKEGRFRGLLTGPLHVEGALPGLLRACAFPGLLMDVRVCLWRVRLGFEKFGLEVERLSLPWHRGCHWATVVTAKLQNELKVRLPRTHRADAMGGYVSVLGDVPVQRPGFPAMLTSHANESVNVKGLAT
eukprot:CAMPEP_0172666956 /NCGR_PEP_ID=MMETSP1074-20121228/8128_1 /TAXON_ID=2916 /ORGANISM="Ceratium fusus, Strain PA161109" /LENGTH=244 /DNA_ID=CAMNT_0013483409 /DNA_START=61 /DNA_END=791 /DNA_ORIENTATION=-